MQALHSGAYAPTVLVGQQSFPSNSEPEIALGGVRYYRLISPQNGSLRFGLKGEPDCPRLLAPGELLFLEPKVFVRLRVTAVVRSVYLAFTVRAAALVPAAGAALRLAQHEAQQPASEAWWGHRIPVHATGNMVSQCAVDVRRIADSWWRGDHERLRANVLLASVLQRLVRVSAQENQPESVELEVLDSRLRRAAEEALHHLRTVRRVSDLAGLAGMSRNRFSDLFYQQSGVTPGAWLRGQRLRAADHLLLTTKMNLSSIAQQCGFSSASTLCKVYRTMFSCTPEDRRQSLMQAH